MRIQNNIPAYNAHRNYNIVNNSIASSAEKLSSGYRINRAGDDAAGLAISEKMRAQIRGLEMASKNSLDAVSMVQTAEGALQKTHDILQRMRELSVQSASDTNETTIDRSALDAEFQQLKEEIDEIARTTRFNDQNLIDGTFQDKFYSIGITNSSLADGVSASIARVGVKDIQVGGNIDIKAQYIAGRDAVNATRARVDTSDIDVSATEAVKQVDFLAELGGKNNGKTFTVIASGEGKDASDLKIQLYDGTNYVAGKITFNGNMTDGGLMDVHFEGIGTMSMLVTAAADVDSANVSKIAEDLNTKTLKFNNASLQVTSGLNTLNTAAADDTYVNGKLTTAAVETTAGIGIDNSGAIAGTAAASINAIEADGTLTAKAVTYAYKDVDGTADAMKAGKLTITIADIGTLVLDFAEHDDMSTNASGEYTDFADRNTFVAAAINGILGAVNNEIATFGAVGGGVDAVEATEASVVLSLNGERVTLSQNDTYAAFDHSGVTMTFNALDIKGMTAKNDVGAATLFTSAPANYNHISLDVVKTDGKAMIIQTGANQSDEMSINIDAMDLNMLGLTNSSIDSQKNASRAITEVNNAINQVSTQRSKLGALQNRLNFKIENLDTSAENLTAAESRIRDVDMAKEMTSFSKKNILSQAATAMLAQANTLPQNVLQLLR